MTTPLPDTWLILADKSGATVYRTDAELRHGPEKVHSLSHPESRSTNRALVTDDRGRTHAGANRGQQIKSGTAAETSAREHEAEVFSKELATWLQQARQRNAFHGAVLVAPPTFLGMLRQDLDDPTLETIHVTIDKQLSHLAEHEVLAEVRRRID